MTINRLIVSLGCQIWPSCLSQTTRRPGADLEEVMMTHKHHPQGSGGRTTSQSHTPTARHHPSSSCWPKRVESAKVRGVAASSNIFSALFLSDSGALCLSICLSICAFDRVNRKWQRRVTLQRPAGGGRSEPIRAQQAGGGCFRRAAANGGGASRG